MSIKGLFSIKHWDFESASILDGLPEEDLQLLTRHMSKHKLAKGEILFREGMVPTGIYYIEKGMLKKSKIDKEGKEQIIYVANQGELVGYHALLAGDVLPDSASALESSVVGYVPKEDFLYALNRSSELNKRLLRTLSHEFTVMANSITAVSRKTVRERVALQLIVMREKYKLHTKEDAPILISTSREDIAGMAGTARENVVRVISELRQLGILALRGRSVEVLDVKRLIEVANV